MDLSDDQLTDIIVRLLSAGVPPTAIAKAFDLDPLLPRQLLATIRAEQYGTEELTEAMTFLIWHAYETAMHTLDEGTPGAQLRMTTQILARPLALAGRTPPESLDKLRDFLQNLASRGFESVPEHDEEDFVVAKD
jgi:hypothetical protein